MVNRHPAPSQYSSCFGGIFNLAYEIFRCILVLLECVVPASLYWSTDLYHSINCFRLKHVTSIKKTSESPSGLEHVTFRTPGGCPLTTELGHIMTKLMVMWHTSCTLHNVEIVLCQVIKRKLVNVELDQSGPNPHTDVMSTRKQRILTFKDRYCECKKSYSSSGMLICRRGYNQNDVLLPNWWTHTGWAYKREFTA